LRSAAAKQWLENPAAAGSSLFYDSHYVKEPVLPHPDRLNIAVFIDFDNIEIGVRTTLGQQFDVGAILDAIKERGEVITKIAYADWTRAGEYSRALTQHAIRLVQRNLTPGGDKNGADINLALDALEMAFTHPHINAYVIVGGDSDFLSLVEKLKQYDKKVFVVGGRAFTSGILQRNCHEFIAYENLSGVRKAAVKAGRPAAVAANAPVAQAVPIVRRALKILADREVTPQTGLLKSTLLQLDSTFSERNYGASSFLDFVEKLAQAGLVTLKHAGRSVMVELNDGTSDDGDTGRTRPPAEGEQESATAGHFASAAPVAQTSTAAHHVLTSVPANHGYAEPSAVADAPPMATESAAEGVARAGRILGAATNARWPMYLRNVKQILRQYRGDPAQADPGGFDERRYGFGGLMDLLKACQREGIVRIERDRRGGLRVFQGQALSRAGVSHAEPGNILDVLPIEADSTERHEQAGNVIEMPRAVRVADDAQESVEADHVGIGPIPIDTTAELLGRAKPKRPRGRTPRPIDAPAPRKTAARKAAPRRSARSKKTSAEDGAEPQD
jgi:uncharacterized LabA/DUF88 family protein